MVPAMLAAYSVFMSEGWMCIISSGVEGKHKRQSAHYTGRAIDLRTKQVGISREQAEGIKAKLQFLLHEDYQIFVEADHIHIEFDPQLPVNYYFRSSA